MADRLTALCGSGTFHVMRDCPHFSAFTRSSAWLIGAVALVGCAPLNAKRGIDGATEQVDTARQQSADKYARYELTKAELFLEQARERNGYGDYEVATEYATSSLDLAKSASQLAKQRKDLERRRGKPEAPAAEEVVDPTAPVAIPGLVEPPVEAPPPKRTFQPPTDDGSGKKKLLPPGMGGGQ